MKVNMSSFHCIFARNIRSANFVHHEIFGEESNQDHKLSLCPCPWPLPVFEIFVKGSPRVVEIKESWRFSELMPLSTSWDWRIHGFILFNFFSSTTIGRWHKKNPQWSNIWFITTYQIIKETTVENSLGNIVEMLKAWVNGPILAMTIGK